MTNERRHPNVVNASEVEPNQTTRGKHRVTGKTLGVPAGSAQLGATLTEIPPGAIGYPFHFHCGVEEAIYILSGTGIARLGDKRVAVGAGDFIAHPIGPDHAHQMINDGSEPLVYLCISTKATADVVGYPDSKKILARAGTSHAKPWLRTVVRDEPGLEYWDGEPNA